MEILIKAGIAFLIVGSVWLFMLFRFKKDYYMYLAVLPLAFFSLLFIFPYSAGEYYYLVMTFAFWFLIAPKNEGNQKIDLGGKIIVTILTLLLLLAAIIGLIYNFSTCVIEIIALTGLLALPMTLASLKREGGPELFLKVLKILFLLAAVLAFLNLATLLFGGRNYALRYSVFPDFDDSIGWRWGIFSNDSVVLSTLAYFIALSLLSQNKISCNKPMMYLMMLVSVANILAMFSVTLTAALALATLINVLLSGRFTVKPLIIFAILILCFYSLFSVIPLPGDLTEKFEQLYNNTVVAKAELTIDPTSGRRQVWREALGEINWLVPKGLGYVLPEGGLYNYHNTILNFAVQAGPLFTFFLLWLLLRQFFPTRRRIGILHDNPFIKGAYLYFIFYFCNEMGTSYFLHTVSCFLITFLAAGIHYFLNYNLEIRSGESIFPESSVPQSAGTAAEITNWIN